MVSYRDFKTTTNGSGYLRRLCDAILEHELTEMRILVIRHQDDWEMTHEEKNSRLREAIYQVLSEVAETVT